MFHNKKPGKNEQLLVKNTVFLYITQISGYFFPLVTFPYLTRVLGPDKYGVVVFANAIIIYFQMFLDFGFLLSATKTCAEYREDHDRLSHIISSVIQAKLILFGIGLTALTLCIFIVDVFADKKLYLMLSYISAGFSIFLPDFYFRGIEKMDIITYRIIFSKFLYTACIFLFVRSKEYLLFIPIALCISSAAAVVLTWYELITKMKIRIRRSSLKETMNSLHASSAFFLSRAAVTAYTAMNTIILGVQYSNEILAQYGVANSLVSNIRSMISPISNSIYPYMVTNKNYRLVKKIVMILMPLLIIGCIGLFVFAKSFILLICGKEYEDAVPVFRAMLPLIIIALPSFLCGYPVMGALEKVHVANVSVIIAAAFHITGIIALFVAGKMTFISIAILTVFTELVVLSIRLWVIFDTAHREKSRVL